MKILKTLFLCIGLFPFLVSGQKDIVKYEKTATFFPGVEILNQQNIECSYLTVPENWNDPQGKKIKIAVLILKHNSKNTDANPVVYLEGGPGAGGIASIWNWLWHPLRKNNDIILMDVRGTGFSFPKFCPDLGRKFLEILSKNQSSTQDEQQKVVAAMACRQDLLNRDIDLNCYNSKSISKDLNALKTILNYNKWNVYGVSYGTYISQVYSNDFPNDIKSLILDSSISDISQYYIGNTENYMNSLRKVFNNCENDPLCNEQFPNLEQVYYETIEKLNKNPISVKVDRRIISTGEFTYNVEDFKISIQQSLYNDKLITVLPLLITEFNKGNKSTLSTLVAAFSGALGLDYGAYYCVSCNEAVPYNSLSAFNDNSANYKKLKGGLSFYKSDFLVCDKWNFGLDKQVRKYNDTTNLVKLRAPVLVFSGGFDPITPASNGEATVAKFKNGFLVTAPFSGHVPSFSEIGYKIVNEFVNNPHKILNLNVFKSIKKVDFVTNIKISRGITQFSNSLNALDYFLFGPLLIALIILLFSILNYIYLLFRNKYKLVADKIIRGLIITTSLLGLITFTGFILAINNTVKNNFYILAFGLPDRYSYLFSIQWLYTIFSIISIFYFAFKIKVISYKTTIATILFSLLLIVVYFQYWGFLL